MVIPRLRSHLHRNKKTNQRSKSRYGGTAKLKFLQTFDYSQNTKANPNGKSVERAGISVIALTGLCRSLVQIDYNRNSGHEEEEENHPKLADSPFTFIGLEEKTYET